MTMKRSISVGSTVFKSTLSYCSVDSIMKASPTVRLMWPPFVIGNATFAAELMRVSPLSFSLSCSLESGQTTNVSINALFVARALWLLVAAAHLLVVTARKLAIFLLFIFLLWNDGTLAVSSAILESPSRRHMKYEVILKKMMLIRLNTLLRLDSVCVMYVLTILNENPC